MPINLGDAVLTFVGDTTQLDAAFDRVNTESETKLAPSSTAVTGLGRQIADTGAKGTEAGAAISGAWVRVAKATVEVQTAQVQLNQALKAAKDTGDQDVVTMLALAQAQQRAALAAIELATAQRAAAGATELTRKEVKEATGTIAVGGEMIGVQLPRHIRTLIAGLPGIGTALSAAFSAVAIIFLLEILAKGIEKLEEWRNAAELLREQWIAIDAEFTKTSSTIQREIDAQTQKFIGLTKGPVAALDFEIKHLSSTAEQTFGKVSQELDKASAQMESQKHFWNFWGDASKDLKKYGADIQEAGDKALKAFPTDPAAQYQAMLARTKIAIADVSAELDKARRAEAADKAAGGLFNTDPTPWVKTLALLTQVNDQLQRGVDLDRERSIANAAQKEDADRQQTLNVTNAELAAEKSVSDARIALGRETNKELYAQGLISYDQQLAAEKTFVNQSYAQEQSALEQRLALYREDPTKNEAIIKETQGRIQALDITHQLDLRKIDASEYQKRATDFVQFMEQEIADTKNGTQDMVDLQLGLGEFLKQTWGSQSTEYINQQRRISASRRALADENKKIAREETKAEEQLASDKEQFTLRYYQYQIQTARVSAATLITLQDQIETATYQRKRNALTKELAELGPLEVASRKRVQGELDLLEQQHAQNRQFYALQTQDVIELSYKQLGIRSAEYYQREEQLAADAYAHVLLSGTAAFGAILRAKQALLNSQIDVARSLGDPEEVRRLTAELARLEAQMEKMGVTAKKTQTSMVGWLDAFGNRLKASRGELNGYQAVFDTVLTDLTNVVGSSFAKWIQGQESFGKALKQGLAEELAVIAGKSLAWSLYFLAWGIADTFWNPPRAGADFASAAEFAAVAAVAGAAAYGLRGSGASGGGGNTAIAGTSVTENNAPSSDNPASATAPASQPVQTTNIQKFAAGGMMVAGEMITEIVRGPRGGIGGPRASKLAIYDEADAEAHVPLPNGRSIPLTINPDGSPAAVLPGGRQIPAHFERYSAGGLVSRDTLSALSTSFQSAQEATGEVAAASGAAPASAGASNETDMAEKIVEALLESGAGGTTVNVEGMISADNLHKFVKSLNRKVNKGQTRLVSSTALRVTRKG